MNFVTMGNCYSILEDCFYRLAKLYPNSKIFFYDWDDGKYDFKKLKRINNNIVIINWPDANETNYMYQKVVCIYDCFYKNQEKPLVYFDSDVIITEKIDEIWDETWDIGATWRPDYTYKVDEFGIKQWLNAGVLFINSVNKINSLKFLEEWKKRCEKWSKKAWWLDQVELIKLFSEADKDLSKGANLTGTINVHGIRIRCKTFHYCIYNFLPEMKEPYREYYKFKPKILHFKSTWRKRKFELLPEKLRKRWIKLINNNYDNNQLIKNLLYAPNEILRKYLKFEKYFTEKIKKLLSALNFKRETEIGYWKNKNRKVKNLYSHEISRSKDYLIVFNKLLPIEDTGNKVIADIGPGPIGGVLDCLNAKEKWAIEPIISEYKKDNIWLCKSENITLRETTCEEMKNVPPEYFDYVFSMNAIDHGGDIVLCLQNIYKILKNGGIFYLHVHCRTPEQLNVLHRQSFDEKLLLGWLRKIGFELKNYKVYEEDPIPTNRYRTFVGVLKKNEGK